MSIVGAFDVHRRQLTFEYLDTVTEEFKRGRVAPADRKHLRPGRPPGDWFVLFAVTMPVAVHCLIAYGVQLTSLRVAIHSIAGCFFYGAFAAKVLLVHSRRHR